MPLWERYLGIPLLRVHDAIYRKTDGRIGHRIPGAPPSLLLHTVGAKTGIARTNTLSYARDGDAYLVVASNGGAQSHPLWYLNLAANPDVTVQVGSEVFTAVASTAEHAEKPRLWQIMTGLYPTYDDYQRKAHREIPLVILTPA